MPGRVRLATVAGTRACRDVGAALGALDDAYKLVTASAAVC